MQKRYVTFKKMDYMIQNADITHNKRTFHGTNVERTSAVLLDRKHHEKVV
jgi:hypothetical protein